MHTQLKRILIALGLLIASACGARADYFCSPANDLTQARTVYGPSQTLYILNGDGCTNVSNQTDMAWFVSQGYVDETSTIFALTGSPSIPGNFSGVSGLFGIYANLTATQATEMETTALFGMTSAVGSANILNYYKAALNEYCTANSGSADCWANVAVVNIGVGGTQRGGVGTEIDLNNAWGNFTGAPVNPYAANLFLSGTNAGGYSACAICIAFGGNNNPMWNYGIYFGQPSDVVFNTATIRDDTNSPDFAVVYGTHNYIIDGTQCACVADLIAKNNTEAVSALTTGAVGINLIYLDNLNRVVLGDTLAANIQVKQSLLPVTDNLYVVGTTSDRWASISAVTYYGGANVAGVSCSGTPSSSFASAGGIVTHC